MEKNPNKINLSSILNLLTIGDKILVIMILLGGIISLILLKSNRPPGEFVIIKVKNQIKHQIKLTDQKELTILGAMGNMQIQINNKKVRVIHSDCPEKICIKSGWINKTGELIVCVPNKVVISIYGKGNDYFDVITH